LQNKFSQQKKIEHKITFLRLSLRVSCKKKYIFFGIGKVTEERSLIRIRTNMSRILNTADKKDKICVT
jgi:hypothetical protein